MDVKVWLFLSGCLSFDPKSVKQWKMQSSSFLDLDFYRYEAAITILLLIAATISLISFPPTFIKDLKFTFRLIEISVNFQLEGVNLQTVRLRELPDCYTFNITVCLTLFYGTLSSEEEYITLYSCIFLASG